MITKAIVQTNSTEISLTDPSPFGTTGFYRVKVLVH